MTSGLYKTTGALLTAFETVFRSKFRLRNLDNVTNHPTLFVPNHFIRLETFIVPYVLYKHTKKTPRSLGDKVLFSGLLGRFLTKLGSISTDQPNRNRIIIADLLKGELDWVIYPEGLMVKSKSVVDEKGNLVIQTPKGNDVPKTGSAVLALKTELLKRGLKKQFLKKSPFFNQMMKKYDIYPHQINPLSLQINPVNITYYPLRPGESRVSRVLEKVFDDLPNQIKEEIKVESQLIFHSDVDITFSKPIDIYKLVKPWVIFFSAVPFLSVGKKNNLITKFLYKSLTKKMMQEIYRHLTINIDHLFCFYLFNTKAEVLDINHLKYFIFNADCDIQAKKFNYHLSIGPEITRLLTEERYPPFINILNFAFKSGALSKQTNKIIINKKALFSISDFHSIRLENTLKVIYNEMRILKNLHKVMNKTLNLSKEKLRTFISDSILNLDLIEYKEDYQKYYKKDFSKDIAVGKPFYLKINKKKKNKIGLVFCHGYKSASLEILELAKHIYSKGVCVYGVRLKGHGTHPMELKDRTWKDWYDSYLRGLVALNADCEKVIVGGFSTGGILALLAASRNPSLVDGVISINAPFKLQDIKANFTSAINFWNELLDLANIGKGRLEYIDDIPEYPEINYSRNYVKGVIQLEKLMKVCREELKKITAPALIIQSNKDPVVNAKSADIIYQSLKSVKKLMTLEMNHHVIVRGLGKEKVFAAVEKFVTRC